MYYYLDSKKYLRKNNFTLLELLKRMVKSRIPFTLLKRGDKFTSYGNTNEVFWPVPKELEIHSSGVMLPKFVINKIFDISDKICKLFLHCYDLQGNYDQNIDNDIEDIYKLIETIDEGILYSSDDEYIALDDGKYILKKDYENYYEREDIKNFYRNLVTTMKGKDNQTSIVFQSVKSHYLFTGDITKRIMNNIVKDTYSPSMKLNSDYEAVKAPHHGTKSHYIKLLFENPSSIKIKKVFISNGTCGKTGSIHTLYSQNTNFDLICSNCDPQKCNSSNCIHRNCPLMCTAMAKSFLIDI